MKTIGFIGGGRITNIFLHAFENSGISLENVSVSDINQDVLNALKQKHPKITITTDNLKVVSESHVVFIAVHPPVLMDTLTKIKEALPENTILISLAPKHTIEKMSLALGGFDNLARMNPSASTIVNKGINPITFSPSMKDTSRNVILELMKTLGSTPEVDEAKIEAYAVISAMGHTYFFFQLQKLKELAISYGMNEQEAQSTITDMLWGTTETLFKSGLTYEEVTDLVPVKPLGTVEETIKGYYDEYLTAIFNKIKP